jgi:hypothetical protein
MLVKQLKSSIVKQSRMQLKHSRSSIPSKKPSAVHSPMLSHDAT